MALICVVPRPALAATDGMVRVTLKEGQSLQDLARQYLGDPNLWTEILKASGLASVPEAKPGVELRVPVTQVSRAGKAVASELDYIQAAT
jgi:nucleoid-associated protein YgaU